MLIRLNTTPQGLQRNQVLHSATLQKLQNVLSQSREMRKSPHFHELQDSSY